MKERSSFGRGAAVVFLLVFVAFLVFRVYDGLSEKITTMDATLVDDLGINSIDQAELVLFCEENFNITVDDEEAQNFKTLGDIVRYLEAAQQ